MPLGIYKPGQGYWVRVLSAAAIGVMVLAGAAWAWNQAGAFRLPIEAHTVAIDSVRGDIKPGDVVTYIHPADDAQGTPTPYGEGTVREVSLGTGGRGSIVVGDFTTREVRDEFGQTRNITTEGGFRARVASISPISVFSQQYLQAGCAGAVLLLGFVLIYWFTGVGRKTGEFLIATDGEMKKVNWSTMKEIRGSTIVVIVSAFLIAGILFSIDWIFAQFFRWIDVLQT